MNNRKRMFERINKKRLVVLVVFIFMMFYAMTWGSGNSYSVPVSAESEEIREVLRPVREEATEEPVLLAGVRPRPSAPLPGPTPLVIPPAIDVEDDEEEIPEIPDRPRRPERRRRQRERPEPPVIPQPVIHRVDFDSNGGTFVWPQYVEDFDRATRPTTPYFDEFRKFEGWFLDPHFRGTAWHFDNPVTTSFTLYAKWGCINPVTIRYNPGIMGIGSFTEIACAGDVYSMTNQAVAGIFRSGFRLESWNTQIDGSGVRYGIGHTIWHATNLEVYAQWVPN